MRLPVTLSKRLGEAIFGNDILPKPQKISVEQLEDEFRSNPEFNFYVVSKAGNFASLDLSASLEYRGRMECFIKTYVSLAASELEFGWEYHLENYSSLVCTPKLRWGNSVQFEMRTGNRLLDAQDYWSDVLLAERKFEKQTFTELESGPLTLLSLDGPIAELGLFSEWQMGLETRIYELEQESERRTHLSDTDNPADAERDSHSES